MTTEHGKPGHNVGGASEDRLRSIVERHERLDEEVKGLRSDQKDIMLEGKSAGYDPKVLRQLLRIRKMDPAELAEQETILDLYKRAMGM
jgi:uncharacterized protein (UPF0335 family)